MTWTKRSDDHDEGVVPQLPLPAPAAAILGLSGGGGGGRSARASSACLERRQDLGG